MQERKVAIARTEANVSLFFVVERITQTDCKSRFIELPLVHKLRTAVIKTEYFVRQVQDIDDEPQTSREAYCSLSIQLGVRIIVYVAGRSRGALVRRIGSR